MVTRHQRLLPVFIVAMIVVVQLRRHGVLPYSIMMNQRQQQNCWFGTFFQSSSVSFCADRSKRVSPKAAIGMARTRRQRYSPATSLEVLLSLRKRRSNLFYSSSSEEEEEEHNATAVGLGRVDSDVIEGPTKTYDTRAGITNRRKKLLHAKLLELDCFNTDETDVLNFENVVQQSLIDPTAPLLISTTTPMKMTTETMVDSGIATNDVVMMSGIQKYGKSTIKTCQTFYYPKTNTDDEDLVTTMAAVTRTARQIEFLYQRHKAQQTQWIRNHDSDPPITSTITTLTTSIFSNGKDSTTIVNVGNTQALHSQQQKEYFPLIIVLDNLRSAQNVGSIYRTADATKCQQIITIGITPNPYTGNGLSKLQKSSLGAELYVPTIHFQNATMALQYITNTYPSYQMIGVETTSESIPYTDLRVWDGNKKNRINNVNDDAGFTNTDNNNKNKNYRGMVFIFGNEVTGVDLSFYKSQINTATNRDVENKVDDQLTSTTTPDEQKQQSQSKSHHQLTMIEIPMYGTKNSLNVAVCVSIILYEIIRQFQCMNTNKNTTIQ